MTHTFAQIAIHAVFATKGRAERLKAERAARVHAYIARVTNRDLGIAYQVGGAADHVHVLFDMKPTLAPSDCLRKMKSVSSLWIHRTFPEARDFAWQEGYGAFAVSASMIPNVKEYIAEQEQHHRRRSFEEEFVQLLERHGIEYDPRYLWKEPAWHPDDAAQ